MGHADTRMAEQYYIHVAELTAPLKAAMEQAVGLTPQNRQLLLDETVLDHLPRVYTPELYEQKCQTVYQHVFDSYQEQNKSLYVN